jgi:nitrite reductase/ring-hydroxylating ferredoxin subunit
MKRSRPIIALFLLLLTIFPPQMQSCSSDSQDYVPYVSFLLNINLSLINNLKVPGYSMKFSDYGYGGVIVFCEYYDNTSPAQSTYHAYDATCTYELSADSTLEVTDNGSIATCPYCGSEVSLFDGYPTKGPATRALRSYSTYLYDETLRVKN